MSKFKKYYCRISVLFAVCVLLCTVVYSVAEGPTTVYAAEIGDNDNVDGLSITYNNNEGRQMSRSRY